MSLSSEHEHRQSCTDSDSIWQHLRALAVLMVRHGDSGFLGGGSREGCCCSCCEGTEKKKESTSPREFKKEKGREEEVARQVQPCWKKGGQQILLARQCSKNLYQFARCC